MCPGFVNSSCWNPDYELRVGVEVAVNIEPTISYPDIGVWYSFPRAGLGVSYNYTLRKAVSSCCIYQALGCGFWKNLSNVSLRAFYMALRKCPNVSGHAGNLPALCQLNKTSSTKIVN